MRDVMVALVLGMMAMIASPAVADELYLKDGSIIHGKIVELEYGKRYVIQVEGGQPLEFRGDQVERFTYGTALPATVQLIPAQWSHQKSPGVALVLSWLIPSAGHAYAGRWERGLAWFAGEAACFAVISEGANKTEYGYYSGDQLTQQGKQLVGLGIIGLIGFRIAEFVDAYQITQAYNRQLGTGVLPKSPGVDLAYMPPRLPASLSERYTGYGIFLGVLAGYGAATARGVSRDVPGWGMPGVFWGGLAGRLVGGLLVPRSEKVRVGVVPLEGGALVAVTMGWR